MLINSYRGKKILVTGHTGFKGSWLSLWLLNLGADVYGYSLTPDTEPNHKDLLGLEINEYLKDIRDLASVEEAVKAINPDIVFHLAAQPLVRRSYREPIETWATNVMGTANLLSALRGASNLSSVIIVTTDKCYKNNNWAWGYRETDELGGHDPYSSSKAATELLVSSFRDSFFNDTGSPLLATARAGNVIGGGDWSEDRLVPDIVRSISSGEILAIRSPNATRPWQHVLESIYGYLKLGTKLIEGDNNFSGAWNFGPSKSSNCTVKEALLIFKKYWPDVDWKIDQTPSVHEAELLYLDSSKSNRFLGWNPVWTLEETIKMTSEWYMAFLSSGKVISQSQLNQYIQNINNSTLMQDEL